MLENIYSLRDDRRSIRSVQEVSLDKSSNSGLKIENNLLFGSDEWFNAIENGEIRRHKIVGTISRVFMSGHNDYPQFEIENSEGTTNWTRAGTDTAYKVGRRVEVIYVEQKFKRHLPLISKCVLEINIETAE